MEQDQIQLEFDKLNSKIDNLYHKLFEDNDVESLQSKINRLDNWSKVHDEEENVQVSYWLTYVPVAVSISLVLGDFLFRYLTGK